jgi:hypothetical protein
MRRLRADRDVLLMDWATSDLPDIRKASIARAILGGVVLAASTGLLPIVAASLIGAAAMIGAGCLNVRQAARAFDLKLYLLIGSAFALGTAMEATGGATVLAMVVVQVFSPLGTTALILGPVLPGDGADQCAVQQRHRHPVHPHRSDGGQLRGRRSARSSPDRVVRRQHLFCHADRLSDQSSGHGAGQVPLRGLHPRRRARSRLDMACFTVLVGISFAPA